jgi:translation initiation factor IF-2
MPIKKIRVYELARELGIENKEAISLCESLGIDVKSHSSSIEEAQADRLRRKAESLGIKKAETKKPEIVKDSAPKTTVESGIKSTSKKSSLVTTSQKKQPVATIAPKPAAENLKKEDLKLSPVKRPEPEIKSGEAQITKKLEISEPASNVVPAGKISAPDKSKALGPKPIPPPPNRLLSPSGKPIPPPPNRLLSPSGKPIPPPPGKLASRPPQSQSGPGGIERPRVARTKGAVFSPTDNPKTQKQFFIPAEFRPAESPSVRQGGPPRGIRQNQRRPTRRRRSVTEELEPTRVTAYVPSDAPVPDYEVIVERSSTAQELGPKLNRSAGDVVRFLLLHGEMVTATQPLTDEMIELFAAEIGARIKLVDIGLEKETELMKRFFGNDKEPELTEARPPVVTVMGHVDHGKTLLLDRIRNANVVASEAGGITQHIGAYQVTWNGSPITFIDTPGHEAFTQMRARGAQVTDIVVLLVAANDGVMPQTVEAINHAKAAGVPIIVALNKMDLPDADPVKTMQQLSEHGLLPEEWGGDTIVVKVSALSGEGIGELLESILLVAEVEELYADNKARCKATVLESFLDVGRGPVATVLVKQGVLKVGDPIVAGAAWGKVKAIINDRGENLKNAIVSMPVQILGLSEPPVAGDELIVCNQLADAREIGETREQRRRLLMASTSQNVTPGAKLESIFEQISAGEVAILNLILKTDVQGSLEAITDALKKLERDDVKISFIHRAVGGITENDVQLAIASNATIIGFNVRPDRRARELAKINKIEIRTYEIIYQVIEDMQKALLGLLTPTIEEVVTGEARVLQVFKIPKIGFIAGCIVEHGVITRGSKVRFLRDGVIIWRGTVNSLRRFKNDVKEVASGLECGIGLSDFQDLKEGDIIETYDEKILEPT